MGISMSDETLIRTLPRALLVLRVTLGLFLLQWGLEKFIVPENTVGIWSYFYGLSVPSVLGYVFGAVEINAELFDLLDVPAYEAAWLDYCAYYNAPSAEFRAKTGARDSGRNLKEGHSRLTAFAAKHRQDPALARRAWGEFFSGEAGLGMGVAAGVKRVDGPAVLRPVDEAPRVSTNAAAQWGLAAIQNLALVGDAVEEVWAARPPRA